MSEAERPKSSWQSWVRSAERGAGDRDKAQPPAEIPADGEDDLDVVLSWEPIDDPTAPPEAEAPALDADDDGEPADVDDEAGEEGDVSDAASWTTWPDDDDAADDAADPDPGVEVDLDDDDDREEYGELLPTVPLLPSIAGRVEALSGVLRAISHRVDGLSASTDVYRATVVDRIDQFTETVLEQGRHTDQSLDEYRRTTERTIAELRRRVAEQADSSKVLLARIEEVATDLTSLIEAPPAPAPAAAPAPAPTIDLSGLRDTVSGLLDEVVQLQRTTAEHVDGLHTLVEVVVDTMPGSQEGSAADVAGALAGVQASLGELVAKADRPSPQAAPAPVAAAPPPSPIDVAELADAVVDRLDLDALAMLVAEHLSATFEVVGEDEPAPAPAPAPAKAAAAKAPAARRSKS